MDSTAPYHALAKALRERLDVISDREAYNNDPTTHLERLKSVSETITTLEHQLPSPVDPQLSHYLQRCSFDKALSFIEHFLAERS